MKKLILLSLILFSFSQFIFSEESQDNSAIAKINPDESSIVDSEEGDPKDEKSYKPYPKNHKTFFLSVENQVTLMKKLLEGQGKDEVIRYFLSLKNYNNQKAIDVLSNQNSLDLTLVILENLPISVFSEILKSFFKDIGGESIPHWSYKDSIDADPAINYIAPPARVQQYINFFMKYNTKKGLAAKAINLFSGATEKTEIDILKARGKRIAKVLNTFDETVLIELLYGRPDTVFLPKDCRIVNERNLEIKKIFYSSGFDWVQTRDSISSLQKSHVSPALIDYILPHLSPELIVAIFAKETEAGKDLSRLPQLINSLGCEKAFNELFEYLADNIKDKVFQICENDSSVLDILDLEKSDKNLLGDGKDKKDL